MTDFNNTDDPKAIREQIETAISRAGKAAKEPKFDWRDVSISAADLRDKTFPEIKWVIPLFMPEGVGILAGKPKAGKSWLDLDWGIAVASGGPIFGGYKDLRARQGDVLMLALEDNERRLKSRINKLGLVWPERLRLTTAWPRADKGGLQALEDWCRSVKEPSLISIDTLAKFRAPASAKANAYDHDYDTITPLKALSDKYGVAILLTHHLRKAQSEDPFDAISGTLGLGGSVDTLMVIDRRASGLILCVRGRDVGDEELAVKFDRDRCRWTVLGDADDVQKCETREKILTAIDDLMKDLSDLEADKGVAPKDILAASGLKISRSSFDTTVYRMARDGDIERVGRGFYKRAVRSERLASWLD